MSERNVIVTGASRGLGLAIATLLADRGYRVLGVARALTPALDDAMRAAAARRPGALEFRAFDLAAGDAIPAFVAALTSEFGAVHGLVNNAGLGTGGMLTDMATEDVDRLVRINTIAPILMARAAIPSMLEQRAGRIINISSVAASTGYANLSVYSATKASLIGFTRSLAREVGSAGITVNAIAPGFVATDMTAGLGADQLDRITRRSALRRLVEPVDVARSVEYLLGDAGRNVTGAVLTVDAGNTA